MIDVLLRKLSSRRKLRRLINANKIWSEADQERLSFYSQFINRGDLVFDIGANTGNRTKVFLKIGAQVVAVEPQEYCVNVLRRSFAENPKFNLINEGLSKSDGEKELFISPENTLSSMSQDWIESVTKTDKFPGVVWDKSIKVKTRTLDQLIEYNGKPKFIKIDVEGFEEDVLLGLSQKCNYVSFEFTPDYLESAVSCLKRLRTLGYEYFQICYGEEMIFKLKDWSKMEVLIWELKNKSNVFGDIYAK